ncbi:MAG: DUF3465 domain-containing protein [Gemmatimonadota bacterium]
MTISRKSLVPRALLVLFVIAGLYHYRITPSRPTTSPPASRIDPGTPDHFDGNRELIDAANQQHSQVQLSARGHITRLLPDDNDGSRHQKFLLRATGDLTVLVVYNLDLAPRIPAAVGDSVAVRGVYIWNEKGGLIHWTHHDPSRKHAPGWVDLGGKRYQ